MLSTEDPVQPKTNKYELVRYPNTNSSLLLDSIQRHAKPCLLGHHLPITQLKSLKSFPIPLVSHDVRFYRTTKITQRFLAAGVFLLVVGKRHWQSRSNQNEIIWTETIIQYSVVFETWEILSWPPLPTIFTLEDLDNLNSLISEKASRKHKENSGNQSLVTAPGNKRAFLTEKSSTPVNQGFWWLVQNLVLMIIFEM